MQGVQHTYNVQRNITVAMHLIYTEISSGQQQQSSTIRESGLQEKELERENEKNNILRYCVFNRHSTITLIVTTVITKKKYFPRVGKSRPRGGIKIKIDSFIESVIFILYTLH